MKNVIFLAAFALATVACAPASNDNATKTESGTTQAAATATTPPPAPVPEEKPMSYYENKVAEIHTSMGEIDVRFFPDVAPNHVRNFIDLAEKGFYNGIKFHRVIPNFMIQVGDPNTISGPPSTWGTGGSEKTVNAEFSSIPHKRGILSMARTNDPNSASSQFFIMVHDYPSLDGKYSVFGQVTKGMDVADKIVSVKADGNGRPDNPPVIESIKVRAANEDEKGPTPK